MKHKELFFIVAMTAAFLGCNVNDITDNENLSLLAKPGLDESVIYCNSFETDKDTAGFTGISPAMFVKDPVQAGGEKSLLIGGGCLQPAGSLAIKIKNAGHYRISFWAKTSDMGGMAAVRLEGNSISSGILEINERTWCHKSLDNLYCPANSTLIFDLMVGGIVYASANIDELIITALENNQLKRAGVRD